MIPEATPTLMEAVSLLIEQRMEKAMGPHLEARIERAGAVGGREAVQKLLADRSKWKAEQAEIIEKLSAEFPVEDLGWLPKGVAKNADKEDCDVCGRFHKPARTHVPYLPGGMVRERLNQVAPGWFYRTAPDDMIPKASNGAKLPGLWIVLTIPGLDEPYLGVGGTNELDDDVDESKSIITDAIRNAAMTPGVGLYLHCDRVKRKDNPNFTSDGSATSTRLAKGMKKDLLDQLVAASFEGHVSCTDCGDIKKTEGPGCWEVMMVSDGPGPNEGKIITKCGECGWRRVAPATADEVDRVLRGGGGSK